MMTSTAATYQPEMQIIVLKPDFTAFANPENPVGFTTPEQVIFFVHEWFHYLHNVSTTLGLATFSNLVTIWSNFRGTFGDDGWSHAERYIGQASHARDIERQYAQMGAMRGFKRSDLSKVIDQSAVRVLRVRLLPADPDRPHELQFLECEIEVVRDAKDLVSADGMKVLVSTHHIVECAAIMLEERVALALHAVMPVPSVDPYRMVQKIARYVAPNLSDDHVLMIALAALQHPNSPAALIDILQRAENVAVKGDDPELYIRGAAEALVEQTAPSAEESLQLLEKMVSLDEPMARAIKITVERLRRNMGYRQEDVFFELGIVEELRKDIASMDDMLRRYGAPTLIQQRQGDKHQIERDLMYWISVDNESEDLSEGWRWMNAAFRFVGAHLRTGKLRPTTEAALSECPFYTVCGTDYRKSNPDNCRQRPWLSAEGGVNICDYAVAVTLTRPVSDHSSSVQDRFL